MCDSRTKKLTHRPAKIPLRKHVNLKTGQKFGLFFVFTYKNLIHATFLSLTFIFHKIPVLVEFPAPGQFSKVKSRPPGKFFELIPGGCPGGCTQLELTETLGESNTERRVKISAGISKEGT